MESQSDNGKAKRSIHRSPGYPVFDLAQAIEKTKAIYANDRRSATAADVIAAHLGYSAAKGPGGRAVSALKQYGLIEEAAGKYRISDLGYTLAHFDRDSTEWQAAAVDAVRRPTLFRELLDEYPAGLPSETALRNDLLKRGFNPSAIPEVIAIVRDSMSLAQQGQVVHNEDVQSESQISQTQPKVPFQPSSGTGSAVRKPNQLAAQVLAISIPRQLSVDIAVRGDELKREDLAKIKSQFNRWIEGLEEAFEE